MNQVSLLLIMEKGPQPGAVYTLQEERVTMGRSPMNTIVINDARISRYHAQIRLMPGGAVLEDMGSTNGTFVNDVPLTSSHLLSPDEVIGLADTVTLRYMIRSDQTAQGAPSQTEGGIPEGIPLDVPAPPPYAGQGEAYAAPPPPAGDAWGTPPPPPVAAEGEHRPAAPNGAEASASAPPIEPDRRPSSFPRWFGVNAVILLVLIVLCIALAAYLWFSPIAFWNWLLGLLGFSVP